jgi:hypothetical protein
LLTNSKQTGRTTDRKRIQTIHSQTLGQILKPKEQTYIQVESPERKRLGAGRDRGGRKRQIDKQTHRYTKRTERQLT